MSRDRVQVDSNRAPPPLTLAIEVSNPSAVDAEGGAEFDSPGGPESGADVLGPSVALARGVSIIDQEPVRGRAGRQDDDLMPAIDRLVRRAGLSARDLERVAVSIGPGGFTGVRVAVATAKAIGEAITLRSGLRACCVGVATTRIAAWHHARGEQADAGDTSGAFTVALASKRESAFLSLFDGKGTPLVGAVPETGAIGDNSTLRSMANGDGPGSGIPRITALACDRHLPETMRQEAARLGLLIAPLSLSAAACARVAATLSPIDPVALLPLYPREPEAVTKWRALHGPAGG
ncbi:MAG: tRNA (adenosine(37)-N6)-threonylcarbamoyltransferase complex dimerization subunit type 1 TsaB [Phycisphaerales bacterium]|nr:tRNA (adenosine(37)-N6)-threonylcarbamoyltransferase complex dimerization subunit type 1 TsaB [Phycisphaerales bacterium]